jgi:hypothetical protein
MLLALVAGGLSVGGVVTLRAREAPASGVTALEIPAEDRAPDSVRIKVEVLNGTSTRGLARRGTLFLRDRGYDVVHIGNAQEQSDSSVVTARSGHSDWAERIARSLGSARVEIRPDSSRYLDITVVLGRSWRPPAEPFYP